MKNSAFLNGFRGFIEQYLHFSDEDWELFVSKLHQIEFKKGETILHQGDVCKNLYFMLNGLARAYIIDENGKDLTWSIFFNDNNSHMINLFVTDYDSFLTQSESSLHIEALEDTILVGVDFKSVQFLYQNAKNGDRFGRLMSEVAYRYLHEKTISRRTKSAKERFEEFLKQTPYLLDKVPQYHIATLLDITPQHLSSLKKECNIKIVE